MRHKVHDIEHRCSLSLWSYTSHTPSAHDLALLVRLCNSQPSNGSLHEVTRSQSLQYSQSAAQKTDSYLLTGSLWALSCAPSPCVPSSLVCREPSTTTQHPQSKCSQATPSTKPHTTHHGFRASGGLFAEEAIRLLQDFYIAGNPNGECLDPNWSSPLSAAHCHIQSTLGSNSQQANA